MSEGETADSPLLSRRLSRRLFLASGLAAAGVLAVGPRPLVAAVPRAMAPRALAFENLHTGERLKATYWRGGGYDRNALAEINHLLRDHRTGEVAPIDPALLDVLHRLHGKLGATTAFQVISGYRSPKTNAVLAAKSGGVARKSFHMQGMAIDVRLPGHSLRALRDTALRMKIGGVGYYPKSDFVHLDVGPVRHW